MDFWRKEECIVSLIMHNKKSSDGLNDCVIVFTICCGKLVILESIGERGEEVQFAEKQTCKSFSLSITACSRNLRFFSFVAASAAISFNPVWTATSFVS